LNKTQDLVSMCIKLTKALLGFYTKDIISFEAFNKNVSLKLKFIEDHIDSIRSMEERDSAVMLLQNCRQLLCQPSENSSI
jgi:hypothetical protein